MVTRRVTGHQGGHTLGNLHTIAVTRGQRGGHTLDNLRTFPAREAVTRCIICAGRRSHGALLAGIRGRTPYDRNSHVAVPSSIVVTVDMSAEWDSQVPWLRENMIEVFLDGPCYY